jgi:hypothetical protein
MANGLSPSLGTYEDEPRQNRSKQKQHDSLIKTTLQVQDRIVQLAVMPPTMPWS